MKKLLRVFVLAALAVAFTFVSCDDDDNGNGNGNNNDTPKKENNLLSGSVTSTMQLSADIEYQLTAFPYRGRGWRAGDSGRNGYQGSEGL